MAFRKDSGLFTQSIFVFQHGTNTIYIYSLGTCRLTFRNLWSLIFVIESGRKLTTGGKCHEMRQRKLCLFFVSQVPMVYKWNPVWIIDWLVFNSNKPSISSTGKHFSTYIIVSLCAVRNGDVGIPYRQHICRVWEDTFSNNWTESIWEKTVSFSLSIFSYTPINWLVFDSNFSNISAISLSELLIDSTSSIYRQVRLKVLTSVIVFLLISINWVAVVVVTVW
jgi:hypothetical protein